MNRSRDLGTADIERLFPGDRWTGFDVGGWLFRAQRPAHQVSRLHDDVPPDWTPDNNEWRVEIQALELAHPEVVVISVIRLRARRLIVTEVRFILTGLGDYDGTTLYRRLGLGAMHRGLDRFLRENGRPDGVSETEWQLELPQPGRAGHPDRHYAEWVAKYLDAVDRFGARRYMPGLLEENPGYNAKNVRRIIDRAEQLGLIAERPGPGRAGGQMTDKCKQLLKED